MPTDSSAQRAGAPSTPILDCLQPPPSAKLFSHGKNLSRKETIGVLLLMFGMVVFAFVGMERSPALYRILDDPWDAVLRMRADTRGLIVLLISLSGFYLAIGVHELGHLCAGWIAGFEFNTISVGPILLFRTGKRLRVTLQRSFLSGRVTMFPRLQDHLKWRLFVLVAGGPLASLLGSTCFVMLGPSLSHPSRIELLLTLFASISFILGLTSLFPFETNDLISDGGRIGMLLGTDGRKERWFALTVIENSLRRCQHPKQWPSALVQVASALDDHSTDSFRASYYAFVWASTLNHTEEAAGFLERSLKHSDKASVLLRKIIFVEAAIFQAWHRNNADRMREWLRRLGKGVKIPLMDLRLCIAQLWVEGKTNDSLARWEDGLKVIRAMKDDKQRDFVERSWLEWKGQIDARIATSRKDLGGMAGIESSTRRNQVLGGVTRSGQLQVR